MAIISIKLRGINYQVACEDGEETRVLEVANHFTQSFDKFANQIPRATDTMLLLMTGLMLQDKLLENGEGSVARTISKNTDNSEEAVSEAINAVSEYIENLAAKIEKM